jgi:hypothetical protein
MRYLPDADNLGTIRFLAKAGFSVLIWRNFLQEDFRAVRGCNFYE